MSVAPPLGPAASAPDESTARELSQLPGFLARLVPEAGVPLYLQMTGYGYRRLGGTRGLLRFHWKRVFLLPLVFPCAWLRIALSISAPNSREELLATLLLGVVAIAAAGNLVAPSPFVYWLANTARRGFLRDLAMARLSGREIILCHCLARLPSVAWAVFVFAELFLFMAIAEGALSPNPNVPEYLTYHALAVWWLSASMLQESESYRCALKNGPGTWSWLKAGFLRTLPLSVVILLGSLFASVVAWLVVSSLGEMLGWPASYSLGRDDAWRPVLLMAPLALGLSAFFAKGRVVHALALAPGKWDALVAETLRSVDSSASPEG